MLLINDGKVKGFQCVCTAELALIDRSGIMHFIMFKFVVKVMRFPLKTPLFPNMLKTFCRHGFGEEEKEEREQFWSQTLKYSVVL